MPNYRIQHTAVGRFYQDEIVSVADLGVNSISRLIRLGAITATPEEVRYRDDNPLREVIVADNGQPALEAPKEDPIEAKLAALTAEYERAQQEFKENPEALERVQKEYDAARAALIKSAKRKGSA